MYEKLLSGCLCLLPLCGNVIGTIIYKKWNEVQSPTIFYDDEMNLKFYEPLITEEELNNK